jgi:hypothetical protein
LIQSLLQFRYLVFQFCAFFVFHDLLALEPAVSSDG